MFSFLRKSSSGTAHGAAGAPAPPIPESPRERGQREARLLRELELVRSLNQIHIDLARAAEHTTGEAALAAVLAALDDVQSALAVAYGLGIPSDTSAATAAPALPPKPTPAQLMSSQQHQPHPHYQQQQQQQQQQPYFQHQHQQHQQEYQKQAEISSQQPYHQAYNAYPHMNYAMLPQSQGVHHHQQQQQQYQNHSQQLTSNPPALPQRQHSAASYYQSKQTHEAKQLQQQQQQQQQNKSVDAARGPSAVRPANIDLSEQPATRVSLDHLLDVDDTDWLRSPAKARVTVRTADTLYEGEVTGTLADMQQGLRALSGKAHHHAPQKQSPAGTQLHSAAHSSSTAPGQTGNMDHNAAGASASNSNKKKGLLNDLTKASPYVLGAIPVKEESTATRGPPQKPRKDVIKLPNNMHTRVVPPSKERGYDLDGYEEYALIDPKRTMANVLKVDTDWELMENPPEASNPAVMYEVAAVGAKIRNTHKVGGERVKEMQFFVESVETPEVRVKAPDIAPLLKSICEASSISNPITIDGKWPFYVQDKYCPPTEVMICYGRILYRLLEIICCEIYSHGMDNVRLCYMTTIRADFSVVATSEVDGKWYFNVLAFEQQDCCDLAAGQLKPERRPWVYWTERVGMVNGVKPLGLYNKEVRQRLFTYLDALGVK